MPAKRIGAVLILTVLLAPRASGAADEAAAAPWQLRYKFAPGQVLRYTIENESSIHVQVGEVAETVHHTATSVKRYKVLSVDAMGDARVEIMIEYVVMSADSDGEQAFWDSRTGADPPALFSGVRETIGKPLGLATIAPTGQILDVTLNTPTDAAKPAGKADWELLPVLPIEPVAIGGTWREDFEAEIMATATLKKTVSLQRMYTLRAIEGGIAVIDLRTIVRTPVRDPLEEGQLIQRTPSGTMTFELASGTLVDRKLNIDQQVVGFQGPQTSLKVVGTRSERLTQPARTAAAPAAGAN